MTEAFKVLDVYQVQLTDEINYEDGKIHSNQKYFKNVKILERNWSVGEFLTWVIRVWFSSWLIWRIVDQDASIIPVPSITFTLLLKSGVFTVAPGAPVFLLWLLFSPRSHHTSLLAPCSSLLAWHTPYSGALLRSAVCPDTHGQLSHSPPVLARISPSQGCWRWPLCWHHMLPSAPVLSLSLAPDMLFFSLNIACTSSKILDNFPIMVGFIIFLLECKCQR